MKTMEKSLMDAMKALSDRRMGNPGSVWTKEQIKALLYGWPRKPQKNVAKVVLHNVQSCREKFIELTSASAKK
jgi:hypothetical protein